MTKYDVSEDLINKLQILLRTESGISQSQPSDQPQSTLHDAIAAVGSDSQDALRCQGCNGELLRGADSIICVFCGRVLRGDAVSPICFTSLFGYHWFLNSLSLDGSEIVERPIEGGNESGRGRSPVVNEIPLSALLDLQLKWPDESDGFVVENEPGKQPGKLVGINLDELCLTERSREGVSGSSDEQNAVVSDKFVGQGSLSLFETAPKESNDGENDDSDWATGFQSANSDVKAESGFHMDSTHWPLNQEDSANTMHFQDLPTSNIESKSELSFDFVHSESNMIDKDAPKGLETVDASLDGLPAADKQRIDDKDEPLHNDELYEYDSSVVWDGNWDNNGMFSGLSSTTKEVDDSFDIWNDFTSSDIVHTNQQFTDIEAPGIKLPPAVDVTLEAFNDTAVLSAGVQKQDDNSLDVWSDFAQSTGVPDSKPVSNEASFGAFSDFSNIMAPPAIPLQSGESKSTDNQTIMPNDDEFGSWSDFGSSMKQPDIGFPELNIIGSTQDNISTGINVENLSLVEDKNSLDDFSWSTSILNQQSHAVEVQPSESKISENHDPFLGFYSGDKQLVGLPDNQLKSNGTIVQNDKPTSANDEEIDLWTDFTSSGNGRANNWHSSNVNAPASQEPVINDLLDDLNTISSAPNKESRTINSDTQFGDSTSSMNPDPFLGMLNDQNAFSQGPTSQPEMPDLARTENQDVKGNEATFAESNDQKSTTVENLISEMHDLSFMLESNLSIPKAAT